MLLVIISIKQHNTAPHADFLPLPLLATLSYTLWIRFDACMTASTAPIGKLAMTGRQAGWQAGRQAGRQAKNTSPNQRSCVQAKGICNALQDGTPSGLNSESSLDKCVAAVANAPAVAAVQQILRKLQYGQDTKLAMLHAVLTWVHCICARLLCYGWSVSNNPLWDM